jgi:hypothetical protein
MDVVYHRIVEPFSVRLLEESDLDDIVAGAGGRRAHLDADRRAKPGADYVLADAIVELKTLDDEGLEKPERQAKLATLFREHFPKRPVIVLDPGLLPEDGRSRYYQVMAGPIEGAVRSARKQLEQTRNELQGTSTTVLWVVNNGYTALTHDELVQMVGHRVRHASEEIDGIVVSGCYFHSDTFDSYFLWPIDYVPIRVDRPFAMFERLRAAWNDHSEEFMTAVVRGQMPRPTPKGPVTDKQFDLDGVTFIKPAPAIGEASGYFLNGRPRKNSAGLTHCPIVATTFPALTQDQWQRFREAMPTNDAFFRSYEEWQDERKRAIATRNPLKPFVPITVDVAGWEKWCGETGSVRTVRSVHQYANALFERGVRAIMSAARERSSKAVVPSRYVLVVTEQIGQDEANDVSHILLVREQAFGEALVRELLTNARLFHDYALALAAAYALSEGIDSLLYEIDLRYAWI